MNRKSDKIIVSNLRNLTKALHVSKQDMCLKCEFASKHWNVLKQMCPKYVFATSKQWNVRKRNKESSKIEEYLLIKV